jgi:hypothetical protein
VARQPLARGDGPLSARARGDGLFSRSVPPEAQQPPRASSSDSIWPSLSTWGQPPLSPGGLIVPMQAPPLAQRPRPE